MEFYFPGFANASRCLQCRLSFLMQKKIIYLQLLLLVVISISCGEKSKPIKEPDRFLEYLNQYQIDSLENLLADSFQIVRTYTNFKTDRVSFFGDYLRRTEAYNGKYKVMDIVTASGATVYLVEDQSDYIDFLGVKPPTWKIRIDRNSKGKVYLVLIDTTESFTKYSRDMLSAEAYFDKWLEQSHPGETLENLHQDDKLLFDRLKEFSNKK